MRRWPCWPGPYSRLLTGDFGRPQMFSPRRRSILYFADSRLLIAFPFKTIHPEPHAPGEGNAPSSGLRFRGLTGFPTHALRKNPRDTSNETPGISARRWRLPSGTGVSCQPKGPRPSKVRRQHRADGNAPEREQVRKRQFLARSSLARVPLTGNAILLRSTRRWPHAKYRREAISIVLARIARHPPRCHGAAGSSRHIGDGYRHRHCPAADHRASAQGRRDKAATPNRRGQVAACRQSPGWNRLTLVSAPLSDSAVSIKN